jgi:GntR family transcriptional regulator
MRTHRDLVAKIRDLIDNGTYQPEQALPTIDEMQEDSGLSRQTVRSALKVLADEGYINLGRGKRPTRVRNRRRIRVPLSRYGAVLAPGGHGGPWERTLAEHDLPGDMRTKNVAPAEAPPELADTVGVQAGAPGILRTRHAMIGEQVAQIQEAWYPHDIAVAAGLDTPAKVLGGVYGALTAAGLAPVTADETVRARMPSAEEAEVLEIGAGVPLLTVERVTKDAAGRVLEVLRVTAASDSVEFLYNNLPLSGVEAPRAQ